MNLQQGLSHRVAVLRQRLHETAAEPGGQAHADKPALQRLRQVAAQVSQIQQRSQEIAHSLRQAGPRADSVPAPAPEQLTWRARRLLLEAKDQLESLKRLGRDCNTDEPGNPLAISYRQTLAISETAIRSIQLFSSSGVEQLRMCDGVEAILEVSRERLEAIKYRLHRQAGDRQRLESLGCILLALVQGRPIVWKTLVEMAEEVAEENREPFGMRLALDPDARAELRAAAHCLQTARVMARICRLDAEWRSRRRDAVLAALVYDAGMAAMPLDVLDQAEPLSDAQRRQLEAHVGLSAEGVKRHAPAEGWLVDVVRSHHERLDGTGYPAGLQGPRIPRLSRLLAVCDVYTALSSPRAYRPALTPRAALTETLLEAERGRLDPAMAEYLLDLSFYPVGTVVELSDGQTAVVVAVNRLTGDLNAPARPVVQVIQDETGRPPPWPNHVNLAEVQNRHIVRSLTVDECRSQLGPRYWQFM